VSNIVNVVNIVNGTLNLNSFSHWWSAAALSFAGRPTRPSSFWAQSDTPPTSVAGSTISLFIGYCVTSSTFSMYFVLQFCVGLRCPTTFLDHKSSIFYTIRDYRFPSLPGYRFIGWFYHFTRCWFFHGLVLRSTIVCQAHFPSSPSLLDALVAGASVEFSLSSWFWFLYHKHSVVLLVLPLHFISNHVASSPLKHTYYFFTMWSWSILPYRVL